MRPWTLTDDVLRLFRELRELRDVPPLVSWFSVDYRLWAGGRFEAAFGHDEPVFPESSTAEDYQREVEMFDESGGRAPAWLLEGAGWADDGDGRGEGEGDVSDVSADADAVPPVEIMSTPRRSSSRAKAATPFLLETEMSARVIFILT